MSESVNNQSNVTLYSLRELHEMRTKGEIGIPAVQRGLVWEPSKIVNLWDSIVKGYPLGIFQCYLDENKTKCLIDGQQRLNSICLGFKNSDEASLWVGISKEQDPEKPVFMVCTRRHPWGYKKTQESAGYKLSSFSASERTAKNEQLLEIEQEAEAVPDREYNEFSIAEFKSVGQPLPNPEEDGVTYYTLPDILSNDATQNSTLYNALRNSDWARQLRNTNHKIVPLVTIPNFTPTPSSLRELFARINRGGSELSALDELYSTACVYGDFFHLKEVNKTLSEGFLPPERITRLAARIAKSAVSNNYEGQVSIEELCKWFNKEISPEGKVLINLYSSDSSTTLKECKELFIKLIGEEKTRVPSYIYLRNREDNWLYVIFYLLYREDTRLIIVKQKEYFPLLCLLPDVMCGTNAANGKRNFCRAFFNAVIKDTIHHDDLLHLMAVGCIAASFDDTFMWPYPDELGIAAQNKKELSDYSTYWLDIYRSIYGRTDNNILYYYQREYVNQMLGAGNFDPASPSTWQGRDNKPWDLDHIIPESWWQNDTENVRNEVGNMQIMYFSHNRGKNNCKSGVPENTSPAYFRYSDDLMDFNHQEQKSANIQKWINLVRLRQYNIIQSVCNELHIFSLINVIRDLDKRQSSSAIVEKAKERLKNLNDIAEANGFNRWGICTYEWKQQSKSTREVTWLPIEEMDFYKSLSHWVIVGKEINIGDIPVLLSVQAHVNTKSGNIEYQIGLSRPIGLSEREWNAVCTKAKQKDEKYKKSNSWFLFPSKVVNSIDKKKEELNELIKNELDRLIKEYLPR